MLYKFRKIIYVFKKHKSFFENARRIQPLLNDTVDFHVQTNNHHQNLAYAEIYQHPVNVVGIRSAQILATKLVVFRPSSRIWPEHPGQNERLAKQIWPEYLGQKGRIPADWLNSSSFGRILASRLESGRSVPDSGHFFRNPATPDSDETVRIRAFISDFGYSSRNPVKVAEILSISYEISSPVIFILFYINILYVLNKN
jgi:hypothetical protein